MREGDNICTVQLPNSPDHNLFTCLHLKYFLLTQSVTSRLETLERTVASQQNIITAQQALLNTMIDTSGGLQSYDSAQVLQGK